MTKTADHVRIPMTLVAVDGVRILAGHHPGDLPSDCVVVLEKHSPETFTLHVVPVGKHEQSLRSFLTGPQAEQCEIVSGIRAARPQPPKPQRRKAKA